MMVGHDPTKALAPDHQFKMLAHHVQRFCLWQPAKSVQEALPDLVVHKSNCRVQRPHEFMPREENSSPTCCNGVWVGIGMGVLAAVAQAVVMAPVLGSRVWICLAGYLVIASGSWALLSENSVALDEDFTKIAMAPCGTCALVLFDFLTIKMPGQLGLAPIPMLLLHTFAAIGVLIHLIWIIVEAEDNRTLAVIVTLPLAVWLFYVWLDGTIATGSFVI